MASAKREPIWGSGAEPPMGFRVKGTIFSRIFTTLNMGVRNEVGWGTCRPVGPTRGLRHCR
jgi:hypothetical protein